MTYTLLREEFIRLLTRDSVTNDRRRKDYNQAIFMVDECSPFLDGPAVFSDTSLAMVLEKFDKALKNLEKK